MGQHRALVSATAALIGSERGSAEDRFSLCVPYKGAGQGWVNISTYSDVGIQSARNRIFGSGRAG